MAMTTRTTIAQIFDDSENATNYRVRKPIVVATKRPPLRDVCNRVEKSQINVVEEKILKPVPLSKDDDNTKKSKCEVVPKVTEDLNALAFSCQLLTVEDVDAEDGGNPQLVSVYVNDIYDYLRLLETKTPIQPNFLKGKLITGHMRSILIDWLVLVALKFDLLQETFYLTVYIIDAYLQKHQVSKTKLQLLGITSMFIAAKYEEIYAPPPSDFTYIADNTYTDSELRKMEVILLKGVGFNFGRPLPLHFLRRYSKVGNVDVTTHTLAKYFMELCMVEYGMCHYLPSHLAAAALCLALKLLYNSKWTPTLVHHSKYTEKDLEHVVKKMACVVLKASTQKLKAVRNKYESTKFMKISCIPELSGDTIKELASAYMLQK